MAFMSTPELLPPRRRFLGLEGPAIAGLGVVIPERGRGCVMGAKRGAEAGWREAYDWVRGSSSSESEESASA